MSVGVGRTSKSWELEIRRNSPFGERLLAREWTINMGKEM